MTHDAINWLREIHRFGTRILEMVSSLDIATYSSSEYPRIGVERYLISLGEAARAAMRQDPTLKERIPALIDANDLRNILTHAYLRIDDRVVWNAVTVELPRLLDRIEREIG